MLELGNICYEDVGKTVVLLLKARLDKILE